MRGHLFLKEGTPLGDREGKDQSSIVRGLFRKIVLAYRGTNQGEKEKSLSL